MLHYLDDLDSKMEAMRAHFERGREPEDRLDQLQPIAGPALAEHREIPCVAPAPPASATSSEG